MQMLFSVLALIFIVVSVVTIIFLGYNKLVSDYFYPLCKASDETIDIGAYIDTVAKWKIMVAVAIILVSIVSFCVGRFLF